MSRGNTRTLTIESSLGMKGTYVIHNDARELKNQIWNPNQFVEKVMKPAYKSRQVQCGGGSGAYRRTDRSMGFTSDPIEVGLGKITNNNRILERAIVKCKETGEWQEYLWTYTRKRK